MTSSNITIPNYVTQNELLLSNLLKFYNIVDEHGNYKQNSLLEQMLKIISGESNISLRIVDWFVTNYAKKYYTVYEIERSGKRFKVYDDYKLKLKAYSKKRFDPFCRWERIVVPYIDGKFIETTIGQLNFFKWAFDNGVLKYIEQNYKAIEEDMNTRNSTSKRKEPAVDSSNAKTRKKREELSVSATKSIKMEKVEIVLTFN